MRASHVHVSPALTDPLERSTGGLLTLNLSPGLRPLTLDCLGWKALGSLLVLTGRGSLMCFSMVDELPVGIAHSVILGPVQIHAVVVGWSMWLQDIGLSLERPLEEVPLIRLLLLVVLCHRDLLLNHLVVDLRVVANVGRCGDILGSLGNHAAVLLGLRLTSFQQIIEYLVIHYPLQLLSFHIRMQSLKPIDGLCTQSQQNLLPPLILLLPVPFPVSVSLDLTVDSQTVDIQKVLVDVRILLLPLQVILFNVGRHVDGQVLSIEMRVCREKGICGDLASLLSLDSVPVFYTVKEFTVVPTLEVLVIAIFGAYVTLYVATGWLRACHLVASVFLDEGDTTCGRVSTIAASFLETGLTLVALADHGPGHGFLNRVTKVKSLASGLLAGHGMVVF